MSKIVDITYVSVWDCGTEIETKGKYDEEKNIVFDVEVAEVDDYDLDICEKEYIILPDGSEKKIVKEDDEDELEEYKKELERKEMVVLKW